MNNKVLINVNVPSLEKHFDIFIPVNRRVHSIIDLIKKCCYELSMHEFDVDKQYALYNQLSYIIGFFAIFLLLINLIFESLIVLQIIQNIIFGFSSKSVIFIVLIRLIYVTIYGFLLYLCFVCSREYKALFIEQKGNSVYQEYQMFTEDFDQNRNNGNNNDYNYQRLNNNGNEHRGYVPFSGQGQTWG